MMDDIVALEAGNGKNEIEGPAIGFHAKFSIEVGITLEIPNRRLCLGGEAYLIW